MPPSHPPSLTLRLATGTLIVVLGLLLAACAPGVRDPDRPVQAALAAATSGAIAERVLPALAAHPGQTGVRLVQSNLDAFALRMLTAQRAAQSLDLQYYIWHDDLTGRLMAGELVRAADRGVRVRLLVDDMDVRDKDPVLQTLDAHPSIEVRLFNPFASASGGVRTLVEFLLRGSRLNRRMHNKAWIADGRVAIVGGRNIGDEYFGAAEETNFSDLDLVLAGKAVGDVAAAFDRYWNSPVAVRVGVLARSQPLDGGLDTLRAAFDAHRAEAADSPYVQHLKTSDELAAILERTNAYDWSDDVVVLSDSPDKADRLRQGEPTETLAGLATRFMAAQRSVRLMSPYFVPGREGSRLLTDLAARGVRVQVITNSLAATDVAAVHGGYAKYRKRLLRGGVALHELKPGAAPRPLSAVGSSGASLHTKAAVIDDDYVFVGSFNVDLRSAWLNCEMGVMVRSESLAARFNALVDAHANPATSYAVSLDPRGQLRWAHREAGVDEQLEREPRASFSRRTLAWLARILPLQRQL